MVDSSTPNIYLDCTVLPSHLFTMNTGRQELEYTWVHSAVQKRNRKQLLSSTASWHSPHGNPSVTNEWGVLIGIEFDLKLLEGQELEEVCPILKH